MITIEEQLENWHWWELAYGVEETATIAELPAEVRKALYSHEVKFGPASEEIGNFIVAYRKSMAEGGDAGIKVRSKMEARLVHDQNSFFNRLNTFSKRSEEYPILTELFFRCELVDTLNRQGMETATVIFWMMTGRFYFDERMVIQSEGLVNPVNRIFADLNLPPLLRNFND